MNDYRNLTSRRDSKLSIPSSLPDRLLVLPPFQYIFVFEPSASWKSLESVPQGLLLRVLSSAQSESFVDIPTAELRYIAGEEDILPVSRWLAQTEHDRSKYGRSTWRLGCSRRPGGVCGGAARAFRRPGGACKR